MTAHRRPVDSDCLPTVAMIGGGQLTRMTHQAAISLGVTLRVLAASAADSAARVAADVWLGGGSDLAELREFAAGADAVTFDHEHVPLEAIRALERDGVRVHPGSAALRYAQDKLAMRERLGQLGCAMPRWETAKTPEEVTRCGHEFSWPVVVKTPRGGYDGKGVWRLADARAGSVLVPRLLASHPVLLVEECVAMRQELSALVARSPYGQIACWPITQTVQRDGVCVQTITPAPELSDDRAVAAQELAIGIAAELGVVGVMAVELFDTGDAVLVNELAMRPHNSGHWTIEGAQTSQFEQHVRAVLDYPLGATGLNASCVVMANILAGTSPAGSPALDERLHHLFAHDPAVRVHLYGKQFRPGRKVGHVTLLARPELVSSGADTVDALGRRANAAAGWLGSSAMLGG
ncbi:MAG: 5-(carboxyamino)imidazole ribonucleotide synthase [Mycobacteriales bacterium]